MFRGIAVMAIALIAVAVTALARRGSNDASPMQDLSSTEQLKQRFQQDAGKVRLIALVSPVCPECRRGFADMQSVLKEIPDDRLRAYIVWLPMFPSDSRSWAQTRSDEFKDGRLSYYWDGGKLTGEEWNKTLGIKRTAWDVYFLYGSGSQWDGTAPAPSFWMHQLGGVTKAPHLNKEEFKNKNGRPRDIPMNDNVREALAELCRDKKPDDYIFVSPKKKESCLQETKRGFHTACRLAGIEGLIWKDLRATFGTRLAEVGCDAFTIAQLLGHSDVRVTMRYVRTVEESKRTAVDAVQLNSRKNVHVLATWPKQPPLPAAVNG